ncbi:MAG: leucyl-tRNA synthetase, partial [Candidatus Paceibacteria bacterium]
LWSPLGPKITGDGNVTQPYDAREIENRWQAHWASQGIFKTQNPGDPGFDPEKPKYYVLDMFPYPSGNGLHVGHPMGYLATDIIARRKRMEGYNVLHPMGYDAFGLPAEQHAIQTGKRPQETIQENIATFRRQMQAIGFSYDWDREFATSDVKFYRWTQWIFARLYDEGLAYQAETPVWWCEELKTVLANEEVMNGRSERGDHPCERRPLKQWMLKITAYADRLIDDLDLVDWPESVKTMQREWIGRSEGAEIDFVIEDHADEQLTVFTTRPDTLFGATFMVIAPEHRLVNVLTTAEHKGSVTDYVRAAAAKSDLERTDLAKDKSGVFTGAYAINPAYDAGDDRSRVPIWVADYVLVSYGSGAIMAVPGQDQRDWEFATKFELPIIRTVQPSEGFDGEAFTGDGPAINSGFLDGMEVKEAKAAMTEHLKQAYMGRAHTNFRLRDWLFSRQRYWGEPFPIMHAQDGSMKRVRDEDLPLVLPDMEDFTPSSDGAAPLGRLPDWVQTTDPESGAAMTRETDTMPGWAGSCWYYLRFMDPHNDEAGWGVEAEKYWGEVDLYVGGMEHAVLHLLYARFWHKVLYDLKLVSHPEPFKRLFNQGMLTAFAYKDSTGRLIPADETEEKGSGRIMKSTGEDLEQVIAKMSKSLKNVVNPDEVIAEYGTDTLRLYEMFMGPVGESKPWNPRDVPGCRRFLERIWRLFVDEQGDSPIREHLLQEASGDPEGDSLLLERELAKALKRINDSFKQFNFNTAIAGMMSFLNEASKRSESLTRSQAQRLVRALSPFAPHIAEELWSRLGGEGELAFSQWPVAEERYLVVDEFQLVVQVLGKVRGKVMTSKSAAKEDILSLARETVADYLEGKTIVKEILVPGRLVNFVVR